MSLDAVKNFAKVTVNQGYDASATSIVLASGHGAKLPNPSTDGSFNLVWWNATDYGDPSDDPNVEIVRCTARSTDTLTVTRAQESTSASTKNTSGKTYKMALAITKKMIDDIKAMLQVITPSGAVNGSNTNYTISTSYRLVAVLRDGIIVDEGAGNDYTYNSGTGVITMTSAPQVFDGVPQKIRVLVI